MVFLMEIPLLMFIPVFFSKVHELVEIMGLAFVDVIYPVHLSWIAFGKFWTSLMKAISFYVY